MAYLLWRQKGGAAACVCAAADRQSATELPFELTFVGAAVDIFVKRLD